ncbi:tetratricopeptide repeat protein [Pedobacter steynii]
MTQKVHFSEEGKQVEIPIKKANYKSYIILGSVVVVLIISLFIWAPWSSGLYNKYAISKQMSVTERGESAGVLTKAAELYNSGDYTAARKIMQTEYMSNPQDPLLSYYFSITLIKNSQEHEARTVLKKLYEGESAFKYDAAYYVALSYIKQDNKKEALIWLSKIPQGTPNYEKAKELSGKL